MSRQRKSIPKEVQAAQQRAAGMISVDPRLDFGSGVSVETLEAAIESLIGEINEYNTAVALLDQRADTIKARTRQLRSLTSRALKGAELRYDKESVEYAMIGGTRPSERKHSARKPEGGGDEPMK
ncbi:MAG: hypothetical protein JSS81_06320 [Acidobacteria bacterium]|nr:hypothetical protein [Acidobacteriota bacterium]